MKPENLGLRPRVVGFKPPPYQLGGLGSAASCPSWARGGAPTAQRFTLFSALRMASPDTTMLRVDHKHWKILFPLNLESIIVHLVMLYDVLQWLNYSDIGAQSLNFKKTRIQGW